MRMRRHEIFGLAKEFNLDTACVDDKQLTIIAITGHTEPAFIKKAK